MIARKCSKRWPMHSPWPAVFSNRMRRRPSFIPLQASFRLRAQVSMPSISHAPRALPGVGTADRTNPLGMAILLGLVSLPLLFLFLPVGLTMLAVAMVMGSWGILATIFRRSSPPR